MSDSVYDITSADGSTAGWHPGQPGNEVGGRRAARLAAGDPLPYEPQTSVAPMAVPEPAARVFDLADESTWDAPIATAVPAPVSPVLDAPAPAPSWATAVPTDGNGYGYGYAETAPSVPTPAYGYAAAPTVEYGYAEAPTAFVAAPTPPSAPPMSSSVSISDDVVIEYSRHAREVGDPDLITALSEVVRQGASDLHVTANAAPSVRVDGSLRPAVPGGPWSRAKVIAALTSMASPDQLAQFEEKQELDFAYSLSTESRFRVNFYQQRGNWGAAFRLIPTKIKTLKDLGIPAHVGDFAKLPRGLVLVTGPTGSGKSTTLAALIDLVNETRADHIVTVEDPIEFMHEHKRAIINQREVGADTHSFANALKHVLRQDPDVILIGELRDLETISVALTAAETGHLVFATLHTQDAPGTIDRVIDVFPPHQQGQIRTQLATTLQGVVCQTLVPKASGSGRVVSTEIMRTTPAIGNLIREGKTYQITSAMQAGKDLGMHTMDQDLADLVNVGTITRKAAMEKVHDKEGFDRLVQRVESPSDASADAIAASGIDFGDKYSGGDF
ncbi:PilT/PilU family type 4a pilus ATPase [Curtobacterium sp. RRHDQ10]|uniref:PilT/PilU family type 4a pilus ATPase n=1 Tax=Curtobacterium phyllosphaerae TaxID=3413379 RepID=UPI003BF15DDD